MPDDTLGALARLLEQERELLLEGRLEAVTELFDRKSALIESLAQQAPADAATLTELRQSARRNQALLEPSGKGLKAASARLKDIRKAMVNLDTYTRRGTMQNLQQSAPSVERRA